MGTVNLSLPADGSTADVSDYNTPLTTLQNEFNGNIDNANIKPSAGIDPTKLATGIPTSMLQNPYKFSVFRNATWTASGGSIKVPFDSKEFDTGSNVDITNRRFTAPADGFYHFDAAAGYIPTVSSDPIYIMLFKNGNEIKRGNQFAGLISQQNIGVISTSVQATANDYFEIFLWNASGSSKTGVPGANFCYFSGFLISTT